MLTLAIVGCGREAPPSPPSQSSSPTATRGGGAATANEAAPATAPIAPAAPIDEGPNGLSGRWKMSMGKMTWTVRLAPREENPSEFLGNGSRDTPDENGRPVTMWIGAVVDGRELRAWLGLTVLTCRGRYQRGGITVGSCIEIGGKPGGAFRAERLDGWPPSTMK